MNLRQKAKRLKQENERLRKLVVPKNVIAAGDVMRIIPVRVNRICSSDELSHYDFIKDELIQRLSKEIEPLVEFKTADDVLDDFRFENVGGKVSATLYVAVKKYDGGKIGL